MPASVKVLKMVSHGARLADIASLPSTITDLKLSFGGVGCDIVDDLPRGIFANSLKALDLSAEVTFASGVLPASLTFLRLTSWSLCNLDAGCIPESVTTLSIGYYENGIVKPGVIPQSITKIDVDLELFRQISRPLSRLTHLSLSSACAAVPGDIPNTVTHLVWHGAPPPNVIPSSVTHLHVRNTFCPFEMLREGVVPSSVTHLIVWIRHLPGSIPRTVTHLTLDRSASAKDGIPDSVTHLTMESSSGDCPPGAIPNSVTHLVINAKKLVPGSLPNSVTHLCLELFHSAQSELTDLLQLIPESVTHLVLPNNFNQKIAK
ncbi:hypothetical protein HDU85_002173, partial [Gaertneriomyces sp. JEL0708]